MNRILTADDFPNVLDAMKFHNAEIDRVTHLPLPEKLHELDKLKIFLSTVVIRIEREKANGAYRT
jgi:hypothetical protein